jgi:hypothetical protein
MGAMLWILALAALCPLVSLATERIAARIPLETKR